MLFEPFQRNGSNGSKFGTRPQNFRCAILFKKSHVAKKNGPAQKSTISAEKIPQKPEQIGKSRKKSKKIESISGKQRIF